MRRARTPLFAVAVLLMLAMVANAETPRRHILAPAKLELSGEAGAQAIRAQLQLAEHGAADAAAAGPAGWQEFKDKTGFQFVIVGVGQYAFNGPNRGRATGSYNLNFAPKLWPGATLIIGAVGGAGNGIEALIGSFANLNEAAEGNQEIDLADFYLEQEFGDGLLTLRIGKLSPTDFISGNDCGCTVGPMFLTDGLVSDVLVAGPEPGFGWTVTLDLGAQNENVPLYFSFVMGNANARPVSTGFVGLDEGEFFFAYEVGATPKFGGRDGAVRLAFWHSNQELAKLDGTMGSGNWGVSFNIEQAITDTLGVFGRYAYAADAYNELVQQITVGLTMGGLPGRENDSAGVGVVFLMPNDDLDLDNEITVEGVYRFQVTDNIAISPHISVIFNPGGGEVGGDDTVVVGGVKTEIEFGPHARSANALGHTNGPGPSGSGPSSLSKVADAAFSVLCSRVAGLSSLLRPIRGDPR